MHVPVDRYGWIEASAEVEFDPAVDLIHSDDKSVDEYADTRLTELLQPEIDEIALVADENSFIQEYRYKEESK